MIEEGAESRKAGDVASYVSTEIQCVETLLAMFGRDSSHALAYFQDTYAEWYRWRSNPSRPSRKPSRMK
jgi:hypothetical protein